MPKINHKNIGAIQKTAYLTAAIASVDSENDTACITGIGQCPSASEIPIFYHCSHDAVLRDNGALEGGSGAFAEDDEVIVQCEILDSTTYKPLYVIGFTDKPKRCEVERVYVTMTVEATNRCFVWDVSKNAYAEINDNDGDPVSFPCDSADISDWLALQVSVGANLFSVVGCGRSTAADWSSCPDWEEGADHSDSREIDSDCGCGLTDIASWTCGSTTFEPCPNLSFVRAGDRYQDSVQNISAMSQSKKLTFLNGGEHFAVCRQQRSFETSYKEHGNSEGIASPEDCINMILYWETDEGTANFYLPLTESIMFSISYTDFRSWDYGRNLGKTTYTDALGSVAFKTEGLFTDKIIAQIYAFEAITGTLDKDCALFDYSGECLGPDCEGVFCCPGEEVSTFHGLKLTAQVGEFKGDSYPDGTDGVDPTGLPRNSSFESVINGMYDSLRSLESVPDDECANPTIGLSIFNG